MVNKKGFMKIVEAMIAILIILGVLLVVSSRNNVMDSGSSEDILNPILNEIAHNTSLRQKIISDPASSLVDVDYFVGSRIMNPSLNYTVVICDFHETCDLAGGLDESIGNIFASERIISSSIEEGDFRPKKVRIFLWRKVN